MTAAGLGHNKGPTMEAGQGWRRHCWTKARRDLLPRMPLEVVRIRVRRARELGLAFATYNTIRTTSGRDIVAFLFSTTALRLHKLADSLPKDRKTKLKLLQNCGGLYAAQPPFDAASLTKRLQGYGVTVDGALAAPGLHDSWSETRDRLKAALAAGKMPSDAVVIVGETALEREWCAAGAMAAFVPAQDYFAPLDQQTPPL